MNSDQFDKIVLERRKQIAREAAYDVCQKETIPMPEINFDGCSQETEDELAHYHPDLKKICISVRQLYKLKTREEIRGVMFHELAHIVSPNHGGLFTKANERFSRSGWRPPSGVIYHGPEYYARKASEATSSSYVTKGEATSSNTESKVEKPSTPKEIKDKSGFFCNQRVCEHEATIACSYCNVRFCNDHFRPSIVLDEKAAITLRNGDPNKYKQYKESLALSGGHPCIPYTKLWKEKTLSTKNKAKRVVKTEITKSIREKGKKSKRRKEYGSSSKSKIPKPTARISDEKYEKTKGSYGMTKAEMEESRKELGFIEDRNVQLEELSEKEREELTQKAYQDMDTRFGDQHGENRWNRKRKDLLHKFKKILGLEKD